MAIQKQKVQFFEGVIADFFSKSGRSELPWRRPGISAYEVWVSEVMLQQTQVSRVIEYYNRFLKKYPTVEHLNKSSWTEFLPYYEGLGYYARGRNMLKTAEIIVTEYSGVFPNTKEELIQLPGIGDYTASAILSFSYNKNFIAWDTNLKRVVGRFFYGSKKAPLDTDRLEKLLLLPRKKLNAALMDFGSSICTARPKCANCPLQKKCVYFQTKGIQEEVMQKARNTFDTKNAGVLLFLHENHKVYYSSGLKKFNPFILPANIHSRSDIKNYFKKQYNLQLAVRPPHKKLPHKGAPMFLVNAQILAGTPKFSTFPRNAVTEYTKGIL